VNANFNPYRIDTPYPILQKIGKLIMLGALTAVQNLVFMGASEQIGET